MLDSPSLAIVTLVLGLTSTCGWLQAELLGSAELLYGINRVGRAATVLSARIAAATDTAA